MKLYSLFLFFFVDSFALKMFRMRKLFKPIKRVGRSSISRIKKWTKPVKERLNVSNLANMASLVSDSIHISQSASEIANARKEEARNERIRNKAQNRRIEQARRNSNNATSIINNQELPQGDDPTVLAGSNAWFYLPDQAQYSNIESKNKNTIKEEISKPESIDEKLKETGNFIKRKNNNFYMNRLRFDPENIDDHKKMMLEDFSDIDYTQLTASIDEHLKQFFIGDSEVDNYFNDSIVGEEMDNKNEIDETTKEYLSFASKIYLKTIMSLDKFLYLLVQNIQLNTSEFDEKIDVIVERNFNDCLEYVKKIINDGPTFKISERSIIKDELNDIIEKVGTSMKEKMMVLYDNSENGNTEKIFFDEIDALIFSNEKINVSQEKKNIIQHEIENTIKKTLKKILELDNEEDKRNQEILNRLFMRTSEKHEVTLYDLAGVTAYLVSALYDLVTPEFF